MPSFLNKQLNTSEALTKSTQTWGVVPAWTIFNLSKHELIGFPASRFVVPVCVCNYHALEKKLFSFLDK